MKARVLYPLCQGLLIATIVVLVLCGEVGTVHAQPNGNGSSHAILGVEPLVEQDIALVALLAVSYHTIRVALTNPAQSLRYE